MLRTSNSVAVGVVVVSGAWSAVIDLYTRRIPNALTFGVAAIGLLFAGLRLGEMTMVQAFAGLAVGLTLMLPGHLIGATGAGDVKLFAAIGTLIGPRAIAMAFLYTALAGGVIAIAVALQRRLLRETVDRTLTLVRTAGSNALEIERAAVNRFAYAPAIAIGTVAAALGF